MTRRLRKKRHRRYLVDVVSDVSQRSHWRTALFASAEGVTYPIDARHHEALPLRLVHAIRRYGLSYRVCVVARARAAEWGEYAEAGFVLFRFEACEFPEVYAISANNPDVV